MWKPQILKIKSLVVGKWSFKCSICGGKCVKNFYLYQDLYLSAIVWRKFFSVLSICWILPLQQKIQWTVLVLLILKTYMLQICNHFYLKEAGIFKKKKYKKENILTFVRLVFAAFSEITPDIQIYNWKRPKNYCLLQTLIFLLFSNVYSNNV